MTPPGGPFVVEEPFFLEEGQGWFTLLKPAGIPVFPPHEDPLGDCVLARLLHRRPSQRAMAWPPGFEGGICHRLDSSTTGLLLVALDLEGLRRIRAAFTEHALEKHYLFVSARDVPWDRGDIDRPIAHDPRRRDRMIVERGAATPHRGRWYPARTRFCRSPLRVAGGTVWEATMWTGVMHQIRAHAASLGLALAGDRLYGGGPPLPGSPPGLRFALHHCGLVGPGLRPAKAPLPDWVSCTLSSSTEPR